MTIQEAETELRAPTAVAAEYLRRTISVSYLVGLAWSGRAIVAVAAVLGLLLGIFEVYSAGPSYTATMMIAPAPSDTGTGALGGGADNLLSSLTGGGPVQVPKFVQFVYTYSSVEVARELDRKYDLLCRIYNSDCDLATHQWKPRTRLRDRFRSLMAMINRLPDPNVGPRTASDLADYLAGTVKIEQNKTTSIATLTYTNRKPDFAAQFLSDVVTVTNDHIRTQSRETQKRYVEYLTQSAAKATNVEQRQAIDTLLLQEERQLMMTEVDVPYAAKILNGPTVAPVYDAFKNIAIFAFLGLILGLALATSRDLLPAKWRIW